ncbi:MAG: hypothetical protein IKA05_02770 [Clostridia bacterium]|nr:hypothetical protein [Clostridia bacterium]
MIKITNKKAILNINHLLFYNGEDLFSLPKGVVFYHGLNAAHVEKLKKRHSFHHERVQYTLVQDISVDEEKLFSGYTKTYQNEIRRCSQTKDIKFFTKVISSEEKRLFELFKQTYNAMFNDKHIDMKFNSQYLIHLAENNSLVYSVAYVNGAPSVFHAYIVDGDRAQLMYSTSNLNVDKQLRNEIGRNNKMLHHEDILFLKNRGVSILDWGGIGDVENLSGIAKFKMGFGGQVDTCYHLLVPNSLLGMFVVQVWKLKHRKKK